MLKELTYSMIETMQPPFPYIHWDSNSFKKWLKNEGFDFNEKIERWEDAKTLSIFFRQ